MSALIDFNKEDFIFIPAIDIYAAKEISHFEKNNSECLELLQGKNTRMMTILEYGIFKEYTKEKFPNFYKKMINSSEAEWLDAELKIKNNKMVINCKHWFDKEGGLKNNVSYYAPELYMAENTKVSPGGWIYIDGGSSPKNFRKITLYQRLLSKTESNPHANFYAVANRGDVYYLNTPLEKFSFLGVRAVVNKPLEK